MSPSGDRSAHGGTDLREGLAHGYEQMRAEVLGGSHGGVRSRGLAILMREGLSAWIRALSSRDGASEMGGSAGAELHPGDPGLQDEVVMVLAEMALASQAGALA